MNRVRKKIDFPIAWTTALIMLVGLSVIHLWINREIQQMVHSLPDGVLVKLQEPLTDADIEMAKTAGYQVEYLEQPECYKIRKDNEMPVLISQTPDFTWNLFGRKIDGESLNLSSHKKLAAQTDSLARITAILPLCLILLIISIRELGAFWEKEWGRGVKGIIIIGICLKLIYSMTGTLRIPREFLPKEQILDIPFYVNGIRGFFEGTTWRNQEAYQMISGCYQKSIQLYGIWIACVWFGTLLITGVSLFKSRKSKEKV